MTVSRGAREKLQRLVALIGRWNSTINLISHRDQAQIWDRHVLDSLQLAPLIPAGVSRAIDLGSGAGFPGLILAIATNIPFDLIEADLRKAAFLREAARATDAPVQVHAVRIEEASILPAALITARGVAPLPKLLELSAPLLESGGHCLFLKGANVATELTQAASKWHTNLERIPSRTSADAWILRISNLARVSRSP
jgi:16S rRNA (guanine527-N7)-methyltransferase